MARIAGVQFEKDAKGKATHVRFDLRKHGTLLEPLLDQLNQSAKDLKQVSNQPFDFEKEWAEGISGEELKMRLEKRIRSWWKK